MTSKFSRDPSKDGFTFDIVCRSEIGQGGFNLLTTIMGETTRKVCDLEDRVVRETLIKLGWTPPPGPKEETCDILTVVSADERSPR